MTKQLVKWVIFLGATLLCITNTAALDLRDNQPLASLRIGTIKGTDLKFTDPFLPDINGSTEKVTTLGASFEFPISRRLQIGIEGDFHWMDWNLKGVTTEETVLEIGAHLKRRFASSSGRLALSPGIAIGGSNSSRKESEYSSSFLTARASMEFQVATEGRFGFGLELGLRYGLLGTDSMYSIRMDPTPYVLASILVSTRGGDILPHRESVGRVRTIHILKGGVVFPSSIEYKTPYVDTVETEQDFSLGAELDLGIGSRWYLAYCVDYLHMRPTRSLLFWSAHVGIDRPLSSEHLRLRLGVGLGWSMVYRVPESNTGDTDHLSYKLLTQLITGSPDKLSYMIELSILFPRPEGTYGGILKRADGVDSKPLILLRLGLVF